ncbi:class I SAM-dependent methyltransferase [Nocardioides ungokensis]|uniref:class I SAM-dependent methyltransferase n=1 Tax=Nocardioides ungokensis TaxID=1643322 RepID=UPI0015DDAA9D|nr:class I SAM-dependent methyltransferase [Nocardioides ungokensis]
MTFAALVAEGEAVPVEGWDFSWFEGRATEGRPPWGYQRLVADRLRAARRVLDVQTGGGEVLAGALREGGARPDTVVATESWAPNAALARQALAPWGGRVVQCVNSAIPCPDASFDLVVSRHPVSTPWSEVARVLAPGGTFVSQQVGAGTVHELSEAMIGPFEVGTAREPEVHRAAAEAAGLEVTRLERASLPMTFDDVGAVVVFLRKVIWTVPEFSVEAYRPQLLALHERIRRDGPFRATSERFLIEAHRPNW